MVVFVLFVFSLQLLVFGFQLNIRFDFLKPVDKRFELVLAQFRLFWRGYLNGVDRVIQFGTHF